MLLKDAEPPPRLELYFYGGLDLSVGITHSDLKMVTATKHLFFVFSGQQKFLLYRQCIDNIVKNSFLIIIQNF